MLPLLMLTLFLPAGHLQAQVRATDEEAIRAQIAAQEAAVNQRDGAAFAAPFVPDGDAIFRDKPLVVGRDAIRRFEEAGFAETPSTMRFTLRAVRIRFLSDNIALVDLEARFSGADFAPDRGFAVMARHDGEWLMASLRTGMAVQRR